MADYAIGDLQGCFTPLERLLERLRFDPARDRLWFVGDLVNRGPQSLECLRFVKSLGERAITVLGNHDLHLVCVAEGLEKRKGRDTLDDVLGAPDRDELVAWLRTRPLMHVEGGFAMVHAGLLPEWTVAKARSLAAEVEAALRGPDYRRLLEKMYGDKPDRWSDALEGIDRLRLVINAMTRLRVVDGEGRPVLKFKGEPGEASEAWVPWFDVSSRKSRDHTIVCGHWSALGLVVRGDLLALDSGCIWGRELTAARLADRTVVSVPCPPREGPED
ncbi:bis(5'-nucleosyl)-tetraphosphatase (symmetrical) [Betaproteobacteria bacterium GR16-43]|nr:bis(5'-nucleosyl)-tetraphosphatase (symmetrical) [Betaproteobacteria bacterium GR16-43]